MALFSATDCLQILRQAAEEPDWATAIGNEPLTYFIERLSRRKGLVSVDTMTSYYFSRIIIIIFAFIILSLYFNIFL
jgi:hypothetical protein